MFGIVHGIKTFIVSIYIYFFSFWGRSLIKVKRKIVNSTLWQLLSPFSEAPVFCKEFGLFPSNTSNTFPLVILKQVGTLTKFARLKLSISSEV